MPYCRECGYEYIAGAAVCPDCQTMLVAGEPVRCESCNEMIEEEATFCPHCGVLLGWSAEGGGEIACDTHFDHEAAGRCVVCGKTVCEACAVKKHGRMFCSNDEHVKMAFDWVAVCSTSTQYEAEMIKANLESAGIPTTVFSQSDRMYFTTLGDLAVTEVMVPKEDVKEAEEYLRAMEMGRVKSRIQE